MSGQLRVDQITDELGTGSPAFPNKIAPASLGTGTPSVSNFLRGDGSWQIIPAPSTADVLAAVAGASYGAVGTYVWAAKSGNTNVVENSTYAGSTLYPAGWENGSSTFIAADGRSQMVVTRGPTALSGTWRAMGRINSGYYGTVVTLFLRIS